MLILTISAGCIQNNQSIKPVSPAEDINQVITVNDSESGSIITPAPIQTDNISHPISTIIQPDPYRTPKPVSVNTPPITTLKPDRTIVFRDRILFALDEMQAAKEGILLTYRAGDIERVREKSKDLSRIIRENGEISDMPSKMDYARMNYYEYTDQASQFAQSFTDGANRWIASDKASANSLFDAAVMASNRADIADKRIRTFFHDHVQAG